jgi:phage tail-like protein
MPRLDPLQNFRFRVEIDGIATAAFSEVAIGPMTVETIDYREGTDPPHVRKIAGLAKTGDVTLKRGLTRSLDIYNWFRQVATGQLAGARRQVVIAVMDEALNDAARFVVSEAWPTKYEASDLNAKGNQICIETLELANEGIERVS